MATRSDFSSLWNAFLNYFFNNSINWTQLTVALLSFLWHFLGWKWWTLHHCLLQTLHIYVRTLSSEDYEMFLSINVVNFPSELEIEDRKIDRKCNFQQKLLECIWHHESAWLNENWQRLSVFMSIWFTRWHISLVSL